MLNVKKLAIKSSAKEASTLPDLKDLSRNLKYFTWIVAYFEQFNIDEINFDGDKVAQIRYSGDSYRLLLPNVSANISIKNEGKSLIIEDLYVKNIDLNIRGKVAYSAIKNEMIFNLNLTHQNERAFIYGQTDLNKIDANLTGDISQINFLEPLFKDATDPDIVELKQWLFLKISFTKLQINNFNFSSNLNDKFVKNLLNSANMDITIRDLSVKLDKDLKPFEIPNATISTKNKKVILSAKSANFGASVFEDFVLLAGDFLNEPSLSLDLKSSALLYNKNMQDALKFYEILPPIENPKGSTLKASSNLKLGFVFAKDDVLVRLKGNLEILNSDFKLFDQPFFSKNTNIIFDISPTQKIVNIDAKDLDYYNILRTNLEGRLDLINDTFASTLHINTLSLNTNSDVNLQKFGVIPRAQTKLEYNFKTSPKNLPKQTLERYIKQSIAIDNEPLTLEVLRINNQSITFNADFKDSSKIRLSLPDLSIDMSIQDYDKSQMYSINIDDLSKLYVHSKVLQNFGLKNGVINIQTQDFDIFSIVLGLRNLPFPLYRNGKRVQGLDLSGVISTLENNKSIQINSLDKSIRFTQRGSQNNLLLNGYDFNLSEFLDSDVPAIKELFADTPKQTKNTKNFLDFIGLKHKFAQKNNIRPVLTSVISQNTNIFYKTYAIPSNEINIIHKDGITTSDLRYKNGIANIDFIDESIFIRANNFSGEFINKIAKKQVVSGGSFSLLGSLRNKVFHGEAKLQNALFRNFVILQNLINLIDTVPSLIVFKNPNLLTSGYQVKEGEIVFAVKKDYLGLEKIALIGDSMDINGNGLINLAKSDINVSLNIQTIKNLSSILSKIPIVGYLILGDSGKISTNAILTGKLSDPDVNISLARDVVNAPFNILRRVFSPIGLIVRGIQNEIEDEDYRR